jgi:hypothetical protein
VRLSQRRAKTTDLAEMYSLEIEQRTAMARVKVSSCANDKHRFSPRIVLVIGEGIDE